MRILMLGWEFPPFITGGLGTACQGLTRALDRLGHNVVFVLPKAVERSHATHVQLLSPEGSPVGSAADEGVESYTSGEFQGVVFRAVPAALASPYPGGSRGVALAGEIHSGGSGASNEVEALRSAGVPVSGPGEIAAAPIARGGDYHGDVVGDAERYARLVMAVARKERFDVVHAHDWMTYPAGMAIARATGRPLVVHIHSTEFDRSGVNVHQRVYDIERRGMHAAMFVVAVSEYTRSIVVERYGVAGDKIAVVYNGVEAELPQPGPEMRVEAGDRIVLFLGRITMQKGPEYFIAAAKRVLEKMDNVKFIVAGAGDMTRRMIELAAEMGIGQKVLFTGFLRGADVRRVFRMADLYVMPSVSEPFGIAPLEAMSHDTPVIISRTSGVSEVLTHALKVDFWDIDEMANKIIAVLRHPPLSQTLREHGAFEVRKLTWEGAAKKCVEVYERAIASMRATAPV